jgi:transposase-like protein
MVGKPKAREIKDLGRPTKFTPEIRALIVDAISHRIPYEYAAEANGITEKTLYNWLDIAREHQAEGIDSEYTIFLQDIKRAEMTRIREHSDMIAAKPERWQADAWILERRWHKHFGPNAAIQELNNRLARLENGDQGNESEKRDAKERNEKDD